MAVVKLKLLTVSGAEDKFDAAVERVRVLPEFAIADAHEILRTHGDSSVAPSQINPYTAITATADSLAELAGIDKDTLTSHENQSVQSKVDANEISQKLADYTDMYAAFAESEKNLTEQLREIYMSIGQLEHLADSSIDLDAVFNLKYYHFRFGHMPRESFDALPNYKRESELMYFIPSQTDKRDVWGFYIAPVTYAVRVDNLFSTLGFVRVRISDRLHGTPSEALDELGAAKKSTEALLEQNKNDALALKSEIGEYLAGVYEPLGQMKKTYQLRAKCQWRRNTFTLCGWVPASDADNVRAAFDNLDGVDCSVEPPPETSHDDGDATVKPPTLLKNFFLFRPFEQFVTMYGAPSYGEFDPTPVVAISYMLFFGLMFGDVGQGAVLIAVGAVMWFAMKMNLGRIISLIGVSSIGFGFFYGSVFGFEDIIHGFNPMENINTTLLGAIFIGIATVLACMIFNIVNGIRRHDIKQAVLSPNGVVGMLAYIGAVLIVLGMFGMLSSSVPTSPIWAVVIVALALLFAAEPLVNLIRRRRIFPDGITDFAFGSFFELFESVLSYLTNTISFIRIGAFALSHIGMMTVVFLLAGAGEGEVGSIPVIIIGNLFVIAFEGLIVGIQVLRLEFYELFGRFYEGDGELFMPFGDGQ